MNVSRDTGTVWVSEVSAAVPEVSAAVCVSSVPGLDLLLVLIFPRPRWVAFRGERRRDWDDTQFPENISLGLVNRRDLYIVSHPPGLASDAALMVFS
jgi:hypothetical protein